MICQNTFVSIEGLVEAKKMPILTPHVFLNALEMHVNDIKSNISLFKILHGFKINHIANFYDAYNGRHS